MTNFEAEKKKFLKELENLKANYDKFTKSVSPKSWRTTGHHFTELKKMAEDIEKFEEITGEEQQKVIEWELGNKT